MLLIQYLLSNHPKSGQSLPILLNYHAEYDDIMIEYLMKYLGLENYEELEDFLKHSHIPIYN